MWHPARWISADGSGSGSGPSSSSGPSSGSSSSSGSNLNLPFVFDSDGDTDPDTDAGGMGGRPEAMGWKQWGRVYKFGSALNTLNSAAGGENLDFSMFSSPGIISSSRCPISPSRPCGEPDGSPLRTPPLLPHSTRRPCLDAGFHPRFGHPIAPASADSPASAALDSSHTARRIHRLMLHAAVVK